MLQHMALVIALLSSFDPHNSQLQVLYLCLNICTSCCRPRKWMVICRQTLKRLSEHIKHQVSKLLLPNLSQQHFSIMVKMLRF
ncbi:hypothetical protein BKA82DRAFT_4165072 [Pisolithus tinctorius]|nr:hypothetical protein BKA82DRAFT_4165072 [Pisolithus tinctorius]